MVDDFARALAEYNPFCFKKNDGHFLMFKDYEEVYVALLDRLFEQFPGGYIDLCVFCVDNCSMKFTFAQNYLPQWEALGCNPSHVEGWAGEVLVSWKALDDYGYLLENIAKGLHLILGTTFNRDMFMGALNRFRLKHKLYG